MNERFVGNCSHLNGYKIQDMVDKAVEIDYKMLENGVGRNELIDKFPIYDWNNIGLQLKDDPCVGFYLSNYDNRPVYFVQWSSIEFVWRMQ